MINREAGLLEIYERIKAKYVEIGLKTFKRNPTEPLREEHLSSICMDEGIDNIIKRASRHKTGYPASRVLEVILELTVKKEEANILVVHNDVRKAVFTQRGTPADEEPVYSPIVAQNTFINENRTEGPMGVDLPGILVMRLVLDLVYTDNGFY